MVFDVKTLSLKFDSASEVEMFMNSLNSMRSSAMSNDFETAKLLDRECPSYPLVEDFAGMLNLNIGIILEGKGV